MSELIVFTGETDGINATGIFKLDSDVIFSSDTVPPPDRIVIPKGMKAKIYMREISGDPATITIVYSVDILNVIPPETAKISFVLPQRGTVSLENINRPSVFRSATGKEGFFIRWEQPAVGKTSILMLVAFEKDEFKCLQSFD
jgi:hypothetical protein